MEENIDSMESTVSMENAGSTDDTQQGTLLTQVLSAFGREGVRQDIRSYSPLTLAYIGDGIYELVIRSLVVEKANRPANELHKTTVQYVNAGIQAAMILALAEELTQEETEVYKRGKNAKTYSVAKNASRSDYHKATGFEALIGYLYLTQQTTRMLYLIRRGLELTDIQI